MIQGYRMSLFKSKCSKSKLLNTTKIAEHSKVFYLKFTDSSRQEHDAVTVSERVTERSKLILEQHCQFELYD